MRLLCALVLCTLAACTGNVQKAAQNAASSAPTQAKDAALAVAVKAKMATIDVDSAAAVHVDVTNGSVALSGEVRSQPVRKQFEDAARSVGGVRALVDRTIVNPKLRSVRESLSDAALLAKVDGTLVAQTGINALKVKTSARGGIVTLSGTVTSGATKQTMLDAVRKLGGVRGVVDRISVQP